MARPSFYWSLASTLALAAGLAVQPAIRPAIAAPERPPVLSDTEHGAWHAVGRLNVRGFSTAQMCTAVLVAPDLVLTAAHCLWMGGRGLASPPEIQFLAGWHRGEVVARRAAAAFHIHPGFVTTEPGSAARIAADVALVSLADPILPDEIAPVPLAPAGTALPPLALVGYRGDRPHALSGRWDCRLMGRRAAILATDCPVTGGASGSPVLTRRDGDFLVAGIAVAGGGSAAPTLAAQPSDDMRRLVLDSLAAWR